MLEINNLTASYDGLVAVRNISLTVEEGSFTVLLGPNGAGKTTLIKTISGVKRPETGTIHYNSERIDELPPNKILEHGISQIPEGARVFPEMSVLDNLRVGGHLIQDDDEIEESLQYVYDTFPILEEREHQKAQTLSGGQRQMLSIGRGLMLRPEILLVDEPSLGLAPTIIDDVFEVLEELHDEGMTILLAEQNVDRALKRADYGYVLESSELELEGKGEELMARDDIKEAYLGMGEVT